MPKTRSKPPETEIDHDAFLREYIIRSHDDPMHFAEGLVIPSGHGPALFDEVMTNFQRETLEDLFPSLIQLRNGEMPQFRRFWIERTKKCSKDGDLGIVILWVTAFPIRPFLTQVGAADFVQAGIVKDRIEALLFYNPWLRDFVEVQRNRVKHVGGGPKAEIEILAADAPGAHGATPDLLITNELSHVPDQLQRWEFIETLWDNASGVPQGMGIVATNAGTRGTKVEKWRDNAIKSDNWVTHIWSKPSPWMNKSDLEDAKKRLPKSKYLRLYYGIWSSGKGDILSEHKVARIWKNDLRPLSKAEPGWIYASGLDLGVNHDHSGLVVVGVHTLHRRIRVARIQSWAPDPKTGEVHLPDVQEAHERAHKDFHLSWAGYDPAQAKLMAQQLRAKGLPMYQVNFTPSNLGLMANTLVECIETSVLESPYDAELERDLGKLVIVEKSYGLRLEATSDAYGHADVGTALVIVLPYCIQLLGSARLQSTDEIGGFVVSDDEVEKVMEEMHPELKEIVDFHDNRNRGYTDDW